MTSYTPAQLHALEWLPKDGSWKESIGEIQSTTLPSPLQEVVMDWGDDVLRYRLTPAGIAERARLVKQGILK